MARFEPPRPRANLALPTVLTTGFASIAPTVPAAVLWGGAGLLALIGVALLSAGGGREPAAGKGRA